MIIELTNTEAVAVVIAIAKQTSSLDALVAYLLNPKLQSIILSQVESLKSVTNKISCQFQDCDILADKPDQEQSTSQISSDALPVPLVAKPVKQPADTIPTPTPPEGFEIISSPGAVNNGEGKNGDLWWSDSSQKWIAVCAPFVHFSPLNIYARIKQPDVAQQGSIKTEDLNAMPTPPEGFEIISSPGAVNDGEKKVGDLIWSDRHQKWVTIVNGSYYLCPQSFYSRRKQPDVAQQDSIKTEDLNVATIQRQRDEIASLRKDVEKYFCNRAVLPADYAELKDQRNEFVRLGGILAAVTARDYIKEGK